VCPTAGIVLFMAVYTSRINSLNTALLNHFKATQG
jgi:hypothetical protein